MLLFYSASPSGHFIYTSDYCLCRFLTTVLPRFYGPTSADASWMSPFPCCISPSYPAFPLCLTFTHLFMIATFPFSWSTRIILNLFLQFPSLGISISFHQNHKHPDFHSHWARFFYSFLNSLLVFQLISFLIILDTVKGSLFLKIFTTTCNYMILWVGCYS